MERSTMLFSWENPLFRLGHFQLQTVSSPEGIFNWSHQPIDQLKPILAIKGDDFPIKNHDFQGSGEQWARDEIYPDW